MPGTPDFGPGFGPDFGIGHNSQTQPDLAWRSYAWRQAKQQAGRQPSVQMVRYHMARAGELGMPYATYAALHRIAGRDPAGRPLGARRDAVGSTRGDDVARISTDR